MDTRDTASAASGVATDDSTRLTEQVARAYASGTALRVQGGNSKHFFGADDDNEVLDTSRHRGIIAYEPTELVVTARAGTPLAELETLLAQHEQMLAFEPPHFGAATVGGCVAAGLSGPRRMASGAVRDFVLGAKLLDGQAQILNFGGQVMKNVAGYDVSRALAGSMGTLGVLLDVSLKVMPRPGATATLTFDLDASEALEQMDRWAGQPLPITATGWCDKTLFIRLESSAIGISAARRRLGGNLVEEAAALAWWTALREHRHAFFDAPLTLWRLALPARTAHLASDSPQIIEWNGQQRWLREDPQSSTLRARAAELGGHAVLFRASAQARRTVGVFAPASLAIQQIEQRLRSRFDPAGIFNPGRVARPGATQSIA